MGTDARGDLDFSEEEKVPPRRFERLLPAPEAGALSTELRGLTRTRVYHRHERLTSGQDHKHWIAPGEVPRLRRSLAIGVGRAIVIVTPSNGQHAAIQAARHCHCS